MAEDIFFSIKLDTTGAVLSIEELEQVLKTNNAAIGQLDKEIERLRDSQKKLEEQGKKNSKAFRDNAADIRTLTKDKMALERTTDNVNRILIAEEGSIEQLRAALSAAIFAYDRMDAATRDTSESGKNLQTTIVNLTDRLKELEGATGRNQRNVGNYEGAIRKVLPSLGELVRGLSSGTKNADTFSDKIGVVGRNAIDIFTNAISRLLIQLIEQQFASKAATASTTTLGAATTATSTATKGLGVSLVALKGALISTGVGAFVVAMGTAVQVLIDFNREVGRSKEEQDEANAALAANRVQGEKRLQNIEQQGRAQANLLRSQGKLNEAVEKERETLNQLEKEFEKIDAEEKKRSKDGGAAAIKLNEIAQRRLELTKELTDASRKAGEDQKKISDEEFKVQQGNERLQAELIEDTVTRELTLFDIAAKGRTRAAMDAGNDLVALEKVIAAERLELEVKLNKDKEAQARKNIDTQVKNNTLINKAILSADLLEKLGNEKLTQEQLKDLKDKFAADSLAALIASKQSEIDALKLAGLSVLNEEAELEALKLQQAEANANKRVDIGKKELTEKKALADAEREIEMAKLDLASQAITSTIELLNLTGNAQKEFGALLKVLAIGEIAVNLMRELSANAVAAAVLTATNPLLAPLAAGLLKLQNTTAIIRAATATATVLAQKFQKGGIIDGPSHDRGGVPARMATGGMVELEGGEAIINKRSTALFKDKLSDINAYGGYGRKFQFGGIPPVTTSQTGLSDIINQIRAINVRPVVSVTEIERVTNNVTAIETAARL